MTLFEEYIDVSLLTRISRLPKASSERILKKLRTEKDRGNLLSTVSEFLFGEFLLSNQFAVEYDRKIDNKTPDWHFRTGDYSGICEVKRINPVNETMIAEELFQLIISEFKSLTLSLTVQINSDVNHATQLRDKDFYIQQAKRLLPDVQQFLITASSHSLTLNLYNQEDGPALRIYIKKIKLRSNKNEINWIYGPESVIYDKRRVYGNEIRNKVANYKNMVTENNLKFYLGLDIHFDNAIPPNEVFEEFVGTDCLDKNSGIRSTILGRYYSDSEFAYLDGLIIRYSGKFHFIANPRCNHDLNEKFKEVIAT